MASRFLSLGFVGLLAVSVVACGKAGAGGAGGKADPARYGSPASGDPVKGTPAWDEHGQEVSCAPPEPHCSDEEPSTEFKDECAVKGYRLIRCGCDMLCTGNISTPNQAYTSKNVTKACAQAKDDCSPPDTSAAFQDACTEAGHKFVVCGCEWLCSGKLKQAVPDAPPPPEEDEAAPEKDDTDKAAPKKKKK
jgi:hypothetical protein